VTQGASAKDAPNEVEVGWIDEIVANGDLPDDLAKDLRAVAEPQASFAAAGAAARPRVAVFCPLVPAEVIWGLGAQPVLLAADRPAGGRADALLQPFCCMRVRAQVEAFLAAGRGEMGFAAAVAPAGCCDSVQNLASVLRAQEHGAPVVDLTLPVCFDHRGSAAYLRAELERWAGALAETCGLAAVDPDRVGAALALWEQLRYRLRVLEPLTATGRLHRSTFFLLSRALWSIDPQRLLRGLAATQTQAQKRRRSIQGKGTIRLGLVSGPLDSLAMLTALEGRGAQIVLDDCCVASALSSGVADQAYGSAVWDRLTRRLMTRRPCPVRSFSSGLRWRALMQKIGEREVQAMIIASWKFCDPHGFDNAVLKKQLKRANIPCLELEIDTGAALSGQLLTRVEAFLESLAAPDEVWV
jgi:benzoyl-CoA reductase/2-hydroxyglutaryl-CoA dehydratase subunit BcrC/BadD/HgdB